MRTILSHGVDLERLEAAAEYLTAFEMEFLTDADCRQGACECRDHAQIVRDAVAALERLEDERCQCKVDK